MTKIEQVVQEFGEPFPLIVRGFAAMGYSKQAVARILDYTPGGFHKILTSWGLHHHFKPRGQQRAECRGKGVPRPQTYSDDTLLGAVAKVRSCKEFRAVTGISLHTIQYRFGSWSTAKELARRNYEQ